MCVSLGAIRKCSHTVGIELFYKGLLKSFYLPSALSFSPDIDTICHSRLEIDSTSSCWKKTDMNSTQSNKTVRLRFSIKYLKLKVVLQMVCLVPVLLAPKLIFYMSTSELLSTNFKDATFIVHLAIQYSFAMMQYTLRIRVSSDRSPDHRQSYVNHLIPKNQKHSSGWLSPTQQ